MERLLGGRAGGWQPLGHLLARTPKASLFPACLLPTVSLSPQLREFSHRLSIPYSAVSVILRLLRAIAGIPYAGTSAVVRRDHRPRVAPVTEARGGYWQVGCASGSQAWTLPLAVAVCARLPQGAPVCHSLLTWGSVLGPCVLYLLFLLWVAQNVTPENCLNQ